jgi:ketosteroid isomerase-like protein
MKGFVVVLLALVLAGLAAWFYYARSGAAPPAEPTEAEIAQLEAEAVQEIEAMLDTFGQAVLRGDAQAVASFWTSDAVILEPGFRVEGSEIPPFMDEVFGTYRYTSWDNTILDLFVHGDVAYAISEYNEVAEAEGQEPMVVNNYSFIRLEKVNGSWKVDRLLGGPRNAP